MSERFDTPRVREFKNDGTVGAGFKYYFYITGTTTLKDTYSDSALTTPNTNPVVADANGRFIDIFLDGAANYKTILTDENDVEIFSADPADSFAIDLNDFDPRPATHWGTTSGGTTAFTASPDPLIASYSNTLVFTLQFNADCVASPTLAIEDLNNPGNFLTAKNIKKYDGAGAKLALEVGDCQADQRYIITYDGTDFVVLNPQKPYISLANSDSATIDIIGSTLYNKNFMDGFVPVSGSDPDEEITISTGKALCEDGSTIVSLDSVETDLNMVTLNGGALGALVSGYLFRYKKDDDTDQWHYEEDTIAPTIADIKSAGAFRRICGFYTDASNDIIFFDSIEIAGGGLRILKSVNIISLNFGSLDPQTLDVFVPKHIDLTVTFYNYIRTAQGPVRLLVSSTVYRAVREVNYVGSLGSQDDVTASNIFTVTTGNGQVTFDLEDNVPTSGVLTSQDYIDNRRIS